MYDMCSVQKTFLSQSIASPVTAKISTAFEFFIWHFTGHLLGLISSSLKLSQPFITGY